MTSVLFKVKRMCWTEQGCCSSIISPVEAETHTLDLIDLFQIFLYVCFKYCYRQEIKQLMRSPTSLWNTEKMAGCGSETVVTYKLNQNLFVWKKLSVCLYNFIAPVPTIQHSKWNSGWLFSSLPPSPCLQATALWTSDVHCVHIAVWVCLWTAEQQGP